MLNLSKFYGCKISVEFVDVWRFILQFIASADLVKKKIFIFEIR